MPENPRYTAGRRTRTEVLGEAHVARSDANRNAFNADFLDFITEGAWGSVWSRPGLTKRERSMITIALLAALGHYEEVAMHLRASVNTGASAEDIKEALLHVAVYAGVPAANQAFKVAQQTLNEMAAETGEEGKP
ncbi:MAG: 4-carboxymuconolactone decarboxylase [Kiloniellaceae bacterium]